MKLLFRCALISVLTAVGMCEGQVPAEAGTAVALQITPVRYVAVGSTEYVRVRVRLTYSGIDVLLFKPSMLSLIDNRGHVELPVTDEISGAVRSAVLDGATNGQVAGTVMFKIAASKAGNLALAVVQTTANQAGTPVVLILARAPCNLSNTMDDAMVYGAAADGALATYMIDESQAAGYEQAAVAQSAAIDTTVLQQLRTTLHRDHVAFDKIAPISNVGQTIKGQVDGVMNRIDRESSWSTSAALLTGDATLSALYQQWPGVE